MRPSFLIGVIRNGTGIILCKVGENYSGTKEKVSKERPTKEDRRALQETDGYRVFPLKREKGFWSVPVRSR